MSIIPIDSSPLERAVRRAGVVYDDHHVILDNGRHSLVDLAMSRIVDYPPALEAVCKGLKKHLNLIYDLGGTAVIPVSADAKEIIEAESAPRVSRIIPYGLEERAPTIPKKNKGDIKNISQAIVFDSVVTDGQADAFLAYDIKAINPSAQLHLIGVWLRGIVLSQCAQYFTSQTFLIERKLDDWPAEDCAYHHPSGFSA